MIRAQTGQPTNPSSAQKEISKMADQPAFALPPLPYGHADLAPVLSQETLEVHHGKHHARYIETLNRLLGEQGSAPAPLEDIVRSAAQAGGGALFNNAAQAWNHSFFWESMAPGKTQPSATLAAAITSAFGSLDALEKRFAAEGAGHFGSGWAWLVARGGELSVISTHDAATPITDAGITPLLACDVWEHAYYIDYRHDRAGWLKAWWDKLANWSFAARQYDAALGQGEAWRFPAPAA
jgi:Fe-Mn family superoxide dismutase